MNFGTSYPVTSELLAAIGKEAQVLAAGGESALQKAEDSVAVVVQLAPIFSQLAALKAEVTSIASDKTGMLELSAVETLVTDFAFTSDKAKLLVQTGFALGEDLVGLVTPIEATTKAVQSIITAVKA